MYILKILNIFLNSNFSALLWRSDTAAGPSKRMENSFLESKVTEKIKGQD